MPLSSVVGAQSIVKPGVCTSSTRPASPYDGQMIYETDTDATRVWNGSAWVGATNTASLNGVGVGAAYTPSTVNWTLGNGAIYARYVQANKLVFVRADIVWGSTSTVTGIGMQVSLPVTAQQNSGNAPLGTVWWYDVSAGTQVYGLVAGVDVNNVMFNAMSSDGTNVGIRYSQSGVPFTFASGDQIYMSFTYEAA